MDYMQTANLHSLTRTNHAVCHNNQNKVFDIFLHKMYWNDIADIIAMFDIWFDYHKKYEQVRQSFADDDPILQQRLSDIRFGSTGGGGISAREKGCPCFSSARATKDGFDAYKVVVK